MVVVRRIRAEEFDALRSVRLAALSDSPSAFGSTYDLEVELDSAHWAERARLGADGVDRVTFVAFDGDEPVGIVGGNRVSADLVELVSMWVAPTHRGESLSRELIHEVVGWARDSGATRVELWVTIGNDAAEQLYRAAGFVDTDAVAPLPSDPCRDERRMRLVVSRSSGC